MLFLYNKRPHPFFCLMAQHYLSRLCSWRLPSEITTVSFKLRRTSNGVSATVFTFRFTTLQRTWIYQSWNPILYPIIRTDPLISELFMALLPKAFKATAKPSFPTSPFACTTSNLPPRQFPKYVSGTGGSKRGLQCTTKSRLISLSSFILSNLIKQTQIWAHVRQNVDKWEVVLRLSWPSQPSPIASAFWSSHVSVGSPSNIIGQNFRFPTRSK